MTTHTKPFRLLGTGLATASSRWKVVAAIYLASLLPALALAFPIFLSLNADLGDRPYAQEALGGNVWGMWQDYSSADAFELPALLRIIPFLLLLSLPLQLMVGAGVVWMLVAGREAGLRTFLDGVLRLTGRFLRSAVVFVFLVGIVVIVFGMFTAAGSKIAENTQNEHWRYGFMVAGAVLALLLFIPLDLAYDLSRISAAVHDGRRTFAGFFRTLAAVIRRPGSLLGLYLSFLVLLVLLQTIYLLLRGGLTVGSWPTILLVLLVHQAVMVARAYLKVGFWCSEIGWYRAVDQPAWCGGEPAPATTSVPELIAREELEPGHSPLPQAATQELLTPRSLKLDEAAPADDEPRPEGPGAEEITPREAAPEAGPAAETSPVPADVTAEPAAVEPSEAGDENSREPDPSRPS